MTVSPSPSPPHAADAQGQAPDLPPADIGPAPLTPWLIVAMVVIGLDQWSKWAIVEHFVLHERLTLTPFFDLMRHHNPGAAFSFLRDAGGWQRWFFTGIAILATVVIISLLRRQGHQTRVAWALALILGGAIGNLIDRLIHSYVIDFLHFHWGPHSFPVFNLADCAISLGAGLLILDEVLKLRRRT